MRRNRRTGLVANESTILVVVAELFNRGEKDVHGYQLASELRSRPSARMSYSTVYRCLDRLADRGFLHADWDTTDLQGPPRRTYRLSPDGLAKVQELDELPTKGQLGWHLS